MMAGWMMAGWMMAEVFVCDIVELSFLTGDGICSGIEMHGGYTFYFAEYALLLCGFLDHYVLT